MSVHLLRTQPRVHGDPSSRDPFDADLAGIAIRPTTRTRGARLASRRCSIVDRGRLSRTLEPKGKLRTLHENVARCAWILGLHAHASFPFARNRDRAQLPAEAKQDAELLWRPLRSTQSRCSFLCAFGLKRGARSLGNYFFKLTSLLIRSKRIASRFMCTQNRVGQNVI